MHHRSTPPGCQKRCEAGLLAHDRAGEYSPAIPFAFPRGRSGGRAVALRRQTNTRVRVVYSCGGSQGITLFPLSFGGKTEEPRRGWRLRSARRQVNRRSWRAGPLRDVL